MRPLDKILLATGIIFFLAAFAVNGGGLPVSLPRLSLPEVSMPDLAILRPRPSPAGMTVPTTAPKPTTTPVPPMLHPASLIIPKLNITSQVESVGMTGDGHMDVPKNAADVGWYMEGPTPSVRGNAVITGHYDTPSGRPAVFYRLDRLVKGDSVIVVLRDGSRHEFVVTGKDVIPYDIFPSEYVFATKYGINLNLITCNGVWSRDDKIYNKRLVIYTTLKGTQFSTF